MFCVCEPLKKLGSYCAISSEKSPTENIVVGEAKRKDGEREREKERRGERE